jgi:photosystem II stability/assembly factor-like uncharacterized protein
MRIQVALFCVAVAGVGCKKGTGTGGGGGGGGWLVGSSGLMSNIQSNGGVSGYQLDSTEELNGIACRDSGEAWVVGNHGTLLYTNDAGATWANQAVPTTANLRTLATQDNGPVFVAGDGAFLESDDTGATWRELGDGVTAFRSVAAATEGSTVMAIGDDGSVWSYDGAALAKLTVLEGARAIAVSRDGVDVLVAGHGLWRSSDYGVTFAPLATNAGLVFDDVRLDDNGEAIAVGQGGAVAMISAAGNVLTQHVGTADLHALRIAGAGWGDATSYAAGEGGQVWMSTNAGWTWTPGPNLGRTVFGVDEIGDGHR